MAQRLTTKHICSYAKNLFDYPFNIKVLKDDTEAPSIVLKKENIEITVPKNLCVRDTYKIICYAIIREMLIDHLSAESDEVLFQICEPICEVLAKELFADYRIYEGINHGPRPN